MGALRRRAVSAAAHAAVPLPGRADHHGGALQAGCGRPGTGRAVQRESEVLRRLLRRFRAGPRPPHRACRHRPQAHDAPRTRARTSRSPELRRRAAEGRIGSVAPRFHGAPTNRSHRVTLEQDCPEIVARCKADEVDAAILVPNCPVCHQTVSLAARMLEENGIATVVMGCAKDIVEHVGVPRFLFSDFPLGNCRRPAAGPGVAGIHARARPPRARDGPGPSDDRAVPARVERRPGLEARLLQHRAPFAGRDHATARRIRPRQGGSPKRCASLSAAGAAAGTPPEAPASTGAAR